MTLELVDLLCEIIRIQTDIIRRQNEEIEQAEISEAAAAELRAKISEAISRELSVHPENRHLSRQLNLLQMSHISTVHAFCGTVIREYGYLLDIPSDFRVLDDGERQELLQKQLDLLLDDAYEKQDPGFLRLTDTLGAGRNDNALCALVTALYEKVLSQPDPEKWLKGIAWFPFTKALDLIEDDDIETLMLIAKKKIRSGDY